MLRAVGLALAALLLVSCGESGSVELPSGSSTRTPNTVPSVTATPSNLARSVARQETSSAPPQAQSSVRAAPTLTRSPETTQTTAPPQTVTATTTETNTQTNTQTNTRTTTHTTTQTASGPTATPTVATQPTSADSGGVPSWLWWVLAAVVLVLAIGIPLLVRSRHRRAWRDDLTATEGEVTWFARTLIADLRRQPSPMAAAGAWNVESSRVVAVEDKLTALASKAPNDADGTRARTLRNAVRGARTDVQNLLTSATAATLPRDLDAVGARLEQALGAPTAGSANPRARPEPR
ncbi:hypothetical protein [Kribbella sp. NPDC004875]|uniref:hypothetical protein n=1 Tax=Kribbella sp. NPDC004875 TaxID=3364107 RepID=UPI0036843F05